MDNLGDLEVFARVVTARSMSMAAREMSLSPAVVSKRMRRLEERLGVRLIQRTTRQLSLTGAGQDFYARIVPILASIEEAEALVASGAAQVRGVLKVTAPTSFGRLHIAPHLSRFLDQHPLVTVELTLSDAFVDIIGEGLDLAVRIAELADTSLVARRLAPNHRVLCATPDYLSRHGEPVSVGDLVHHRLMAHNADHWRLESSEGDITVRLQGPLRTNSSEVVREALLSGLGIALRSTWDVGPELRSGRLKRILPAYSGGKGVAIHAVYPSRRHMEQKVRVFVDFLAGLYGPVPGWDEGLVL
jgi:DNA-binding transcriptional LysR family regulator